MIFQGIRTSIVKQPNIFVFLQGRGVCTTCPPLWIRPRRVMKLKCNLDVDHQHDCYMNAITGRICLIFCSVNSWADHKGGDWKSGPPEKSENKVVFLAILVQIPWKITRLPCQPSILGHHRLASKAPFKCRLLVGRWWLISSGIWIL